MVSPVARSWQAHGFSTKKKKKIQRIRKSNPSRRWQRNQSGGREIKPQCPILPIQSKSAKANQTQQATANQTQRDRGVYLKKKKKIPNTQSKSKPQQTKPSNPPQSRRRDATARSCSSSPSSLAPHRRSEIADCSASAPVLPPALPQGISLFFSLTITEMKNEMKFW